VVGLTLDGNLVTYFIVYTAECQRWLFIWKKLWRRCRRYDGRFKWIDTTSRTQEKSTSWEGKTTATGTWRCKRVNGISAVNDILGLPPVQLSAIRADFRPFCPTCCHYPCQGRQVSRFFSVTLKYTRNSPQIGYLHQSMPFADKKIKKFRRRTITILYTLSGEGNPFPCPNPSALWLFRLPECWMWQPYDRLLKFQYVYCCKLNFEESLINDISMFWVIIFWIFPHSIFLAL